MRNIVLKEAVKRLAYHITWKERHRHSLIVHHALFGDWFKIMYETKQTVEDAQDRE